MYVVIYSTTRVNRINNKRKIIFQVSFFVEIKVTTKNTENTTTILRCRVFPIRKIHHLHL